MKLTSEQSKQKNCEREVLFSPCGLIYDERYGMKWKDDEMKPISWWIVGHIMLMGGWW